MENKSKTTTESHEYFPSGEWEGFFLYGFGPGQGRHPMSFHLTFSNSKVTGAGTDEVGSFNWNGHYDTVALNCVLQKEYRTHPVFYKGCVDQSGIWGTWYISEFFKGGFHIWPKKNGAQTEEEAEQEELLLEKLQKELEVLKI